MLVYIKKRINIVSSSQAQEEVVNEEKQSMNECFVDMDYRPDGGGADSSGVQCQPCQYLISARAVSLWYRSMHVYGIRGCDSGVGQRETDRR